MCEAERLAGEEAARPFDLTMGPLLRARLLKLSAEEHVLLFTMQHIIGDGWSAGVLIREVVTLYEAFTRGEESPLEELPIQYGDYAVWQRERLQGAILDEQLTYWREQMSGAPEVLELPTDHPRPVVQSFQGASHSLTLSEDLTRSLRELSQREGVTLFMTLLAAFQVLLSRYTGQEDIVVGTPIAGRTRREMEALIGFFVNTLALRTDLSGEPTFRELLKRVREVALGAYAHQELPFERLVEELQPERSLSHAPLFQVMFNLLNHNDVEDSIKLQSLTVETTSPFEANVSKFDLTLYALERNEKIQFDLVYDNHLFENARMVEMLRQLRLLLSQIVERPDENIKRLSLITPEAEALLPNPSQELSFRWEGAVQTLFSEQSRRVPDKLAVKDKQDVWDYRELESRSNQLANYLLASGVKSQGVVAIYGQRGASLVWALLGVLKAGAAFLILDPSYPAARLINYLRAAKPQGWLQIETDAAVPDALAEYVTTISCRCQLKLPARSSLAACDPLAEYSTDNPGVASGPDDPAYIAFTSGSTGIPKGVLGTHGPLSHFIRWHSETFNLDESDRFSMLSGLAHDPLLRDVFTPLCLGATLCIPDSEHMRLSTHLAEWMAQEKISITHLTPAMGQILTGTTAQTILSSLRYAFYGAEALTKHDCIRLHKLAPSATCVNFYGATETPQAVGYFVASKQEDKAKSDDLSDLKEMLPLGRGIEGIQLLALNSCQKLAGVSEVGEIYVRSHYLAKGYINDDELTRERFIANPFTRRVGDFLYRTGDLGRYLPDGNIEFLGRIDHQVKIRGYRIELGEIEAVLGEHSSVRQTVVTAREDESGEKRLVAYIVSQGEEAASVSELRGYLKEKLPQYMIPSAFVQLDELPLTPNGKVDRKALPAPEQTRPEQEKVYVAPRTKLEAILTGMWRRMLNINRIGIYDDFFELGGNSLNAAIFINKLEEKLGEKVRVVVLFKAPNVHSLASYLSEHHSDAVSRICEEGDGYDVDGNKNIASHSKEEVTISPLIEIQPEGSKRPFFCVHPIGGHVYCYADLARYLGVDQPFYGLQSIGLGGEREPHTQIEDMAADYVRALLSVQPQGPYLLGGYSFGSMVAFEMAQQLQKQGQTIELLALFDTEIVFLSNRAKESEKADDAMLLANLFEHLPPLSLDRIKQLNPDEQLTYMIELAKTNNVIPSDLEFSQARNFLRVLRANFKAAANYVPQPYPGQITFFQASEQPATEDGREPSDGLRKLATGGVKVYEVPGNHVSMFLKPHVKSLAAGLKACLDELHVMHNLTGKGFNA